MCGRFRDTWQNGLFYRQQIAYNSNTSLAVYQALTQGEGEGAGAGAGRRGRAANAPQIISKSCSFSPETEFTPLILA